MKLVGWARALMAYAMRAFLNAIASTRQYGLFNAERPPAATFPGRDFGAGREESPEGCARGRKGDMPERRVFKLTAGSKGKGTGIPAVYQSCFARVERLLRDGRVDACRFDGFHNKGGAC